ncbi:MAG: hypothetical protein MMC23_003883 [Stictis urceolatum]|nr:hypothetical protein [Stictis urceolata]
MPLPPSKHLDCPFCAIAAAYPASQPPVPSPTAPSLLPSTSQSSSPPISPTAHLLLSTPHVIAFLDHAPISRGHVLVATRQHRIKVSDASIEETSAIGSWLGILSRAVVRAARDLDPEEQSPSHAEGEEVKEEEDVGDWNIVQNNGARAAQVVPHVHFHIIPRVGDVPEVKARSWTVFGKGQREELDEDDAGVLTGRIRRGARRELEALGRREGEGVVRGLIGEGWRGGGSKL